LISKFKLLITTKLGTDIAHEFPIQSTYPTQHKMKNLFSAIFFVIVITGLAYCSKKDKLPPKEETIPPISTISFKQDTVPVILSITAARKEKVGSLNVTAVEGKLPDSIVRKNNLIIRLFGDSARAYNNTEILVSYTDSLGMAYTNVITDTLNKVSISKMEKKKDGLVEGNFTIRVSNSTKTKTFLLTTGKISTAFTDY
jgi:hypothetical protein